VPGRACRPLQKSWNQAAGGRKNQAARPVPSLSPSLSRPLASRLSLLLASRLFLLLASRLFLLLASRLFLLLASRLFLLLASYFLLLDHHRADPLVGENL
jgi:hypothetical protein